MVLLASGRGSARRALTRLRAARMPPAAAAALAVSLLAQVAYPLFAGDRAALSTVVVTALVVGSVALAVAAWGPARGLAAAAVVVPLTFGVEALGVHTGFPFGDYAYSATLRPQLAGVPLIVPLAWCALALPAREVASRLARGRPARALIGGAALTAWDLFLDPQMLHEGFWHWTGGGAVYRGIPLSNFAGWLVAGTVVVAVVDLLARRGARCGWLLGVYVLTWVMETVGFAVFFGDPLVALVGGIGMGVPALLALRPGTVAWRNVA